MRDSGAEYPVIKPSGVCVVCGEPIQPGQLFVRSGPRHLGCREPEALMAAVGRPRGGDWEYVLWLPEAREAW